MIKVKKELVCGNEVRLPFKSIWLHLDLRECSVGQSFTWRSVIRSLHESWLVQPPCPL